ncbi:LacI family DNA-binding transcriptional regulator [Alkaliphilus transvaalensis]|uniref:LacI family DNA-binding transcriptional regulator n=1 Tax=Alkaliphilus transvaalensis TaxID=114628 RepID=UPI0004793AF1|nr:LacI family DNA-binding transcriptional regulator [Alkaliphilus transvaalensis]
MKVTIRDVARLAEVSPSTVSRALKNSSLISQSTKDRIINAANELGYHPNEIARSLAKQSSYTLGLVLPVTAEESLENPFFTRFILGVTSYLESQDYSLLLSSAKNESNELQQIQRTAYSKRVDGIILLNIRDQDKNIAFLKEKQFPFVVVGTPENRKEMLWVDNDNEKAMYNLTKELILTQHKKIAFLGGSKDLIVTQNRLKGYKKALLDHNMKPDPSLILEVNFRESEGYYFTQKLLKEIPDIDAIVTTDDLIAYGSIRAIKELGYQIPNEISITGFNNTTLSQYLKPSLTSVEIHPTKLGANAAKLLVSYIKDNEIKKNSYIVNTEIIKRNSSR